jgi:hypothetical protein
MSVRMCMSGYLVLMARRIQFLFAVMFIGMFVM